MYIVLRFYSPSEGRQGLDSLILLGESLNQIRPGTFSGLDGRWNGFSCDVCSLDSWNAHLQTIEEVLRAFTSVFKEASNRGIEVEFDVAVEPEDLHNKLYVAASLGVDLFKKLIDQKVGITFTFYPGPS